MTFTLSTSSRSKLMRIHPDLVRVIERAVKISPQEFQVCQGARSVGDEAIMVAKGKSKTMNSLHIMRHYPDYAFPVATAVDLDVVINGKPDWAFYRYANLNDTMQQAARLEDVTVEWGGNWHDLKDGDHWQLPRDRYVAIKPQ